MLAYIHVIIEFMSQPEYGDLIPMFGIVNEACLAGIGRDVLTSLQRALHQHLRWLPGHHMVDGLPPGSDRIIFDTHPYFAFDGAPNDSPMATSTDPLEAAGIWLKLLGIARREHMERAGVKQFALAPMDPTRDWFFLMNKVRLFGIPLMDDDVQIGPALDGGMLSPLWSYQFGLQTGFMPTDPRHSVGICAALDIVKDPSMMSSARGRRTAQARGRSPPRPSSRIAREAPATPLPTHIAAASITCLTFMTPVAGCTYPDTWKAIGSPVLADVHGDAVAVKMGERGGALSGAMWGSKADTRFPGVDDASAQAGNP
ncbi:hypothetical protein B0H14DRAFT_3454267 [Mycena olivaceomarginata]|nr:hypothetical protein B0H14DRAFT_3454267 [Mycena olivaceomarginata]